MILDSSFIELSVENLIESDFGRPAIREVFPSPRFVGVLAQFLSAARQPQIF